MSDSPIDIISRLKTLLTGTNGSDPWPNIVNEAIAEIEKSRAKIENLAVMQDSYSKLYKQIYGGE